MLKEYFELGRTLAKKHIDEKYSKEKSRDIAIFLSGFTDEPDTYILGWQAEWKILEIERTF